MQFVSIVIVYDGVERHSGSMYALHCITKNFHANVSYYLMFFFSTRRRHTRSLCDWSSDVCSSDLTPAVNLATVLSAARSKIFTLASRRVASATVTRSHRTVTKLITHCQAKKLCTVGDTNANTRRSEEHTSELQSHSDLVCRLLLEK